MAMQKYPIQKVRADLKGDLLTRWSLGLLNEFDDSYHQSHTEGFDVPGTKTPIGHRQVLFLQLL